MNTQRTYAGKYFSILGDSISTLAGYNPPQCAVFYDWANKYQAGIYAPEDTWWGRVIDALGGRLLVNNAWSGSLVCKHPQCEIESYGCSDDRTSALGIGSQKPDVVMILMGLNDFGWAMRPTAAAGEQDLAVFSVAYEAMLQKLRRNYPAAEIWCLTLPQSQWSAQPDFAAPRIRGGWHVEEYCRVIRDCGSKAGCKVIDISDPAEPYDTIDGYHPNCAGMQTLAAAVLRAIGKEGAEDDH